VQRIRAPSGAGRAGAPTPARDGVAYERYHERVRAGEVALFYDVMWWLFVRPLLALCRVRAIDAHHVPRTGAVILAPNHTASIDHLLVAGVCGRRLSFMAKSSLFDGRMRFVNRLGAFPVQRGTRDEQAIETSLAVLRRNGCLVMYCEGTISRDGWPRATAKPGIGRLALCAQVPVVPVAILGAHEARPRRPARITLRFGEPVRFEGTSSYERDRDVAAQVLETIRRLHATLAEDGHDVARAGGVTTGSRWPWRR